VVSRTIRDQLPQKSCINCKTFFMMYRVYVIYSQKLDKYYVGYSGDSLEERLRKHNTNHKGFSGRVGDWTVVYSEEYEMKQAAILREKQIKGSKSRKMIEKLIGS
jgi:putative endonuclease